MPGGSGTVRIVRRRTVRTVETRAVLATLAACALAAGVAAVMLLAGGSLLLVVVLVVAQVALLLAVRDGARRPRQFVLAWSAEAGLSHAVAGDPTLVSALVYLGVGLVFALAVVAFLAFVRPEPEEPRIDTAPLPVPDTE